MKKLFPLLTLSALLSGCAAVEIASPVTPPVELRGYKPGSTRQHIHISNYGYYLFNCIPIFAGDTRPGKVGSMSWFQDDVRLPSVQNVLVEKVKEQNAQIDEIQPHTSSTCCFASIPYVGTTFGLVWYKEVQLSAVIVNPPPQPEQPQTKKEANK